MRINKFIAQHSNLSRRNADEAIAQGRVLINNSTPKPGQEVNAGDTLSLDGNILESGEVKLQTIMLNKPLGYVVSRDGQGSRTIYDLLPTELHNLKPVGRLDKYSSGLLLLTNDGNLAQQLTHPSHQKQKIYQVKLSKPLSQADVLKIKQGINLEDGPSHLELKEIGPREYQVTMTEGRNRQIRRTFAAIGYGIISLHRTEFGSYKLENLPPGKIRSNP
jgi:23S rRNA pseudouridine2605 synthase